MLKNFKNMFIKSDEEEQPKTSAPQEKLSFPVNDSSQFEPKSNQPLASPQQLSDPAINEVIKVYENGLESINMPGYDFFEFYQSVIVVGNHTEQAYNMAYQMARTLDKTITSQKLIQDAEFYISKINEVHNQYISQGNAKLHSIQEKKNSEKSKLNNEIDQDTARIAQLRAELHQLETDINNKRIALGKLEDNYYPNEKAIKEKLAANDYAQKNSIDKINTVKEGILRFIKG